MPKRTRKAYTILARDEYHTIKRMIRAGVSPTGIKKETGRAYATIKRVDDSHSWPDYCKDRQGAKYDIFRRPTHAIKVEKLNYRDPDDAISEAIRRTQGEANTWKFFAISSAVVLVLYVIITQLMPR